ncbi:MAG: hypothetical protein HQL21_05295 [Candidatus Omnitrophica bacterium]|nr:hypothetical protein [Candidatus Omnitrophota bacterium]
MSAQEQAETLLSLPYTQYVETERAPDKVGMTIYNRDKAFSGYNIYASFRDATPFVQLIDMDGHLVHRWAGNPPGVSSKWERVTPFPDGSIFLNSVMTSVDWQWVDVNSHTFMVYDIPGQMAHHAGGGDSWDSLRVRFTFLFKIWH